LLADIVLSGVTPDRHSQANSQALTGTQGVTPDS